jgi:hypothetical protein
MNNSHFCDVLDTVRSACALTEESFLQVGGALHDVVQVLAQQGTTFETLLQELDGAPLTQAFEQLSWSAAQVTRLGHSEADEHRQSASLRAALDGVAGRLDRMLASVAQAFPLAVNAKILAAQLSDTGVDFSTFADEITRTLRVTRSSLGTFQSGLQAIRDRVAAAAALRGVAGRDTGDAVRAIASRLAAAVEAVASQHARASRASLALQQQNSSIRRAVGEAVGALQIGDTTRQRLEHADLALGLIAPPPPGAEPEAQAIFATICQLQSAQLDESADHFRQAVGSIAASLRKLANDARTQRSLGTTAFAGGGGGGGGEAVFSAALEAQVGEALGLFEAFRTAREHTVQVVAAVTDATASLCRQLRTVQALEADIRIMGLNAVLKCGRIGDHGRALRHVAQELCDYVDQFAGQARALIAEVERAAGVAAALAAGSTEAARLTGEVAQAMQGALATLREKGSLLGGALGRFETDGARVITLLDQTGADLTAQERIGTTMRNAAAALGSMAAASGGAVAALPASAEHLLDQIEHSYTMAAERVIHDRVLGRAPRDAGAPAAAAAFELEDMLF